jgi:hypothetical protein
MLATARLALLLQLGSGSHHPAAQQREHVPCPPAVLQASLLAGPAAAVGQHCWAGLVTLLPVDKVLLLALPVQL